MEGGRSKAIINIWQPNKKPCLEEKEVKRTEFFFWSWGRREERREEKKNHFWSAICRSVEGGGGEGGVFW